MDSITIQGKTFKAKKCTMFVLLKVMKLEAKLDAADKAENWDEYAKLWMDKIDLFLEGETVILNPDNITAAESRELNDFFTASLAATLPRSESGNLSSGDSTPSEAA